MAVSIHDMQAYFEERMAKFETELQKKPSSATGSLAEEFTVLKKIIIQSLKLLSEQTSSIFKVVDNLEMHSRRKILLLHGVKEQAEEDTAKVVTDVFKQHLKLQTFLTADIKRCHRMGRQASSERPRPELVKLQSVTLKDSIWFSKTKLKGTGITLSEFLTKLRHKAFMAARQKFGINKCWTRDGYVYVLGADGNRHRIVSISDLSKIQCLDTEKTVDESAIPRTRRKAASKK